MKNTVVFQLSKIQLILYYNTTAHVFQIIMEIQLYFNIYFNYLLDMEGGGKREG